MLRLTTFGGLALSRDGVALTGAAAQRSRLSLLALLATAGPTGFSRDKLLLYLWPESDEERARHALKQAVYSLRKELGSEEVIVGTAALSLNPVIITSDAREFEAAIAANDLATAVSLYTGPFLDGFHLKDSTEYERWSAETRARLAHMWVASVEKLAADCESRGAWREAAGYWRTLAASEPLSGRLALSLMRALAESGDLGAALQQFRIHEALLREEIGSAPEAAVTSFADALKSGTWVRSPEPPRVSPASGATHTLVPSLQHTAAIQVPAAARHSIGSARKRRRRSTALAFVLGAVLVLAIGFTYAYAKIGSENLGILGLVFTRPAAQLEPHQIVVAPLENKTGDTLFDPIGDQIADWFARELREADFKVVDPRTARQSNEVVKRVPRPFRAADNVALGDETRSAYAIIGNYYRIGRDSLEANLSVVDVATRQSLKSLGPFRASAEHSDSLIEAMLQPVVDYLRREVDTTAGGRTTRYSSPASRHVTERVNLAWEHFFQNPSDTVGVFAELNGAAQLDSMYPMPPLMKAYMLDVKAKWPDVQRQVNLAKPLEPRMSKLEKGALELFEADLRGDQLARLEIARRLQVMSPGSTEMPLLRVVSALYLGNVSEAELALKDVDPNRGMNLKAPMFFEWSAATYHHSGDAVLERKAVEDLQKRFKQKPPATWALARLQATANDSKLEETLRRGVPQARDRDARADSIDLWLFAARELRAHGHDAEARKLFGEVTKFWSATSSPASLEDLRDQARAVYETGDDSRARALFQSILARDSTDIEAMGRIGAASIRLGDQATAKSMEDRLKRIRGPYLMGGPLRWQAVIASARGKTDDAVQLLDSAIRQGFRLLDNPVNLTVHLDRDFVGIEKTAAYRGMVQSLTDASMANMTAK
jgi:DNA-binding SARP family transcriptional activator